MAITGMASGNEDAIRALLESLDYEKCVDSSGAWKPDYSHVGGVFHSACTGEIRSGVCTPVAYERYDFGFESI
jgi:hypothetical protein